MRLPCPPGPYRNISPTHSFAFSLLVNTPHRAMGSPSTEDYLKTLHKLEEQEDAPVSTGALAQAMNVSSASASNMIERLDELDFLTYEADEDRDLLKQRGLLPRATVEVLETHPLDGLLVVAVNGAEQVIGRPVAQKVVVEA